MSEGWIDKYFIAKFGDKCGRCNGYGFVDGETQCPECDGMGRELIPIDGDAIYFVLRLDKDPHARAAALAYANSVEFYNITLAEDIRRRVMVFETKTDETSTACAELRMSGIVAPPAMCITEIVGSELPRYGCATSTSRNPRRLR